MDQTVIWKCDATESSRKYLVYINSFFRLGDFSPRLMDDREEFGKSIYFCFINEVSHSSQVLHFYPGVTFHDPIDLEVAE